MEGRLRRRRRLRYGSPCRRRRAPVSERNAAFVDRAATTCSTPARPPLTTRRRPSATLAISSSFSAKTGQPAGVAGQDFGRHHDIARLQRGIQSAATPKLMTPRIVVGSKTVRSARNCCGSLLLQMTVMPGPAAMRASCDQTSHDQYRPRVNAIARGRAVPSPPISHSDPYHPAVGVPQVPIPRQRPERKELRITMIAQIKHPRKACCRVALLVP